MRLQPIRQTGDLQAAFEQRRDTLIERHQHLTRDLGHKRAMTKGARPLEAEHREMLEQLESMTRKEIERVQNALLRLDQGEYGKCAICRQRISRTRLEALPFTLLCLCCAEANDR